MAFLGCCVRSGSHLGVESDAAVIYFSEGITCDLIIVDCLLHSFFSFDIFFLESEFLFSDLIKVLINIFNIHFTVLEVYGVLL